jgi:DNA-directed RNA polymerase specialized sigma24 family protein
MQAPLNTYANIDGHELFRRAIVDGDEVAWAEGVARYRTLLVSWAKRCAVRAAIGEPDDDIADRAFSRAWAALSPERFDQFPTLASVLAYLRTCVTSAVIDCARGQQSAERLARAIAVDDVATPEQIFLNLSDREALWDIVQGVVQTEQERVILVESFLYGLPPRAILARYPQLFSSAVDVYNAKRNLFERLKRCQELRQIYQGLVDV